MNGYIAFYNGQRAEIHANTTTEALRLAVSQFRVPARRAHSVTVVLAEKDGKPVVHRADF